ncbi:unnamed protein product [Diamesa tonsa]
MDNVEENNVVKNSLSILTDDVEYQMDPKLRLQEIPILENVMTKFKEINAGSDNTDEIISVLSEMEFLVHDVDNALKFIHSGGFETVIRPFFKKSLNVGIRSESMKVLGAVLNNNPEAKEYAITNNIGKDLIEILSTETHELNLMKVTLYAFGSLLRNSLTPKLLFQSLPTLKSILHSNTTLKIKVKTLTLLVDLNLEQNLSICQVLEEFIEQNINVISSEDQSSIESLFETFRECNEICASNWYNKPTLRSNLIQIKKQLELRQETKDSFVIENIQGLLDELQNYTVKSQEINPEL